MSPSNPRDYVVGRGRPPRHSQFRKGQSGNPKGRPRRSKNFDAILTEVLYQPVAITIKGKRKHVSLLEAIVRQAASRAAALDWRFLNLLLRYLSQAEAISPATEDGRGGRLSSIETINALLEEAEAAGELPD